MKKIEEILKETIEENQQKVDWTAAWSGKYPVLKTYQKEVDIEKYATRIGSMCINYALSHRRMLAKMVRC